MEKQQLLISCQHAPLGYQLIKTTSKIRFSPLHCNEFQMRFWLQQGLQWRQLNVCNHYAQLWADHILFIDTKVMFRNSCNRQTHEMCSPQLSLYCWGHIRALSHHMNSSMVLWSNPTYVRLCCSSILMSPCQHVATSHNKQVSCIFTAVFCFTIN